MSTNSNIPDLPLATRTRRLLKDTSDSGKPKVGLTKGQKTKVIDGAIQTVGEAAAIAQTLVDSAARINEIRATSIAEVARIEAETRQIEVKIAGMIEVLVQNRKFQESRGAIAVQIITEVTRLVNGLPDSDDKARQTAIEMLPSLVESALKAR